MKEWTLIEWVIAVAVIGIVGAVVVAAVMGGGAGTGFNACHEQRLSNGVVCLVCPSYGTRPDTVSCGGK